MSDEAEIHECENSECGKPIHYTACTCPACGRVYCQWCWKPQEYSVVSPGCSHIDCVIERQKAERMKVAALIRAGKRYKEPS